MSMMFLAAMMMAQAPAAAQPAPAQAPAAKKHKPAQICEDVELTGSRAKRHICHDSNVDVGSLEGVSHSIGGKGKMDQQDGQSAGGPGGFS
jgi:hypothetical protein